MTATQVLIATLQIGGLYALASLIYLGATAICALCCRLPIREVSLFMGPRVLKFRLSTIKYSIRVVPLGSYVSLGHPNDDDSSDESVLLSLHPALRAVLHSAGPVALLLGSLVIAGWQSASSHAMSAAALPYRVLVSMAYVRTLMPTLFEAFAAMPIQRFFAALLAYYGVINLLPIPPLPGARVVGELVSLFWTPPARLRDNTLQLGFTVLLGSIVYLAVLYINFLVAAAKSAA